MKAKGVSSSVPSRFRLGLTFAIAIMVITSPIPMFANPTQVSGATIGNNNSYGTDSSGYHSTPSIPAAAATTSPLSSPTPMVPAATTNQGNNGGDFTSQAALSLTRASQTNNFVASKAYYDISFRTATAGVIKSVVIDFPAGTAVGSALIVEAVGIGPGTLAASAGEVLTYTVTNAVNVPALTTIRIQISNINNPSTPSGSLTVSITTRDAASATIDGPTATSAYNMVQVSNAQIAPGAVTTTKIATGAVSPTDIAQSLMKSVLMQDNPSGNARGWNPDGVTTAFAISEPAVTCSPLPAVCSNSFSVTVYSTGTPVCDRTGPQTLAEFTIRCSTAPAEGDTLGYVITNLPTSFPS